MFKMFFTFLCLLSGNFLFPFDDTSDLSFYKETDHFQTYCLEQDNTAADLMLQNLEQYWIQWNQDIFSVPFSNKIKLSIFPDIQSYHLKILGNSSAPDWVVCTQGRDFISLVSPKNPGSIHSEESIMKCGRLCLGWIFTYQKYGDQPRWLVIGLPYYEVKMYSKDLVDQYLLNKNNELEIPLLSQLETLDGHSLDRSGKIACYLLTEFLIDQWGLDKALALLNDYSSFETILGVSKEEFRIKCIQHCQSKLQIAN